MAAERFLFNVYVNVCLRGIQYKVMINILILTNETIFCLFVCLLDDKRLKSAQ